MLAHLKILNNLCRNFLHFRHIQEIQFAKNRGLASNIASAATEAITGLGLSTKLYQFFAPFPNVIIWSNTKTKILQCCCVLFANVVAADAQGIKLIFLPEQFDCVQYVTYQANNCILKTLPKAQRTRGLSSYHKFKHKS